jgi:hypothetical protein
MRHLDSSGIFFYAALKAHAASTADSRHDANVRCRTLMRSEIDSRR